MVLSGINQEIAVIENDNQVVCYLTPLHDKDDLAIHRLSLKNSQEFIPKPITLGWKFPAKNVQGVWKPTADFSKRIEADWELQNHESRISIDAPVISLFGSADENRLCFSCSNAVNRIELSAKYREEDDHFYCKIILFTECRYPLKEFTVDIRIDYRDIHFAQSLREVSTWWESYDSLKPAYVPDIAKKPLYSTWYQFHQDLDENQLISECSIAKKMGFEAIIIDDGWQTKDNNRGYDFTGDWQPERFPNFKELVKSIQDIGMKVGIWYSVPFCGVKSKAYQKFKGKFLTENHRWAPVFDPRYPEVRQYLVETYVEAVKNYGLDGLKLDFIDDFKSYPETSFEWDGKDILSINGAVDRLLSEVSSELKKINPEIFIEFRQKYTGPAIRKYGNMLRAFDCPGDYIMNRVRIADIKMLAGNTAVHSDMVTWHKDESVEIAALHYMNTLFGVPQVSVMLDEIPESHVRMIGFFTKYWEENKNILLSQNFYPKAPSENYPALYAEQGGKKIIGLYSDHIISISGEERSIDIINSRLKEHVVILSEVTKEFTGVAYNCCGELVEEFNSTLKKGCNLLALPKSGILQIKM
ncbi:glycoside hydrolase family 36 protein [Croceivirga thetidis]|uniref:Alpha-galactosidase n=1 Tax=Croceivirga thetidis TaxID=2721623 RepID=A0ABX1GSW7_9FLAO|nr:glycoside hydrolase family 36 protein [Croceivirga thetidis]NKI33054.1 alpha-galactosidase [Croceivirga thetidis]